MKIYLAARYSRKPEMQRYARWLKAAGHECTSTWLEPHIEKHTDDNGAAMAELDMADVKRSNLVIVFNHALVGRHSTGGHRVEMGAALAWGIPVALVGRQQTVFDHHPGILLHCMTFRDVLATLGPGDSLQTPAAGESLRRPAGPQSEEAGSGN